VDAAASAAAVALPLMHGTLTGPAVAGALGALTVCELAAGHGPWLVHTSRTAELIQLHFAQTAPALVQ